MRLRPAKHPKTLDSALVDYSLGCRTLAEQSSGRQAITDKLRHQVRIYTIKGRVQGVWFRDSTRREALKLGITGYAKNLPNGDVEVLANGNEAALDRLCQWLHEGPPMAKVSSVHEGVERSAKLSSQSGFTVA